MPAHARYAAAKLPQHHRPRQGRQRLTSFASWNKDQFDLQLSWKDVEWIRKRWGGKLILKGVLDKEDASLAVKASVDAVVVSNQCTVFDLGARRHCRNGRRQSRGVHGWRNPFRPGRAEGAVRPVVPVRLGDKGRREGSHSPVAY